MALRTFREGQLPGWSPARKLCGTALWETPQSLMDWLRQSTDCTRRLASRVMNDKGRYHTLMDFTMPSIFPDTEFRAFGIAAGRFFPALLSDEVLYDPLEKRRHFDSSWQAVRYRYRSCAECSEEFQ